MTTIDDVRDRAGSLRALRAYLAEQPPHVFRATQERAWHLARCYPDSALARLVKAGLYNDRPREVRR